MIVREHERGGLCIPQSQHAAISGQMARAWGNEAFPVPEPQIAMARAAERHDDGMDPYDASPDLDPDTGLPRGFMRMELGPWLECWRRGPEAVGADSPYGGILVSLHGRHLLGYREIEQGTPEAEAVEEYLAEQERLRERLAERAADDPEVEPHLDERSLERNRRLIALWDAMSLAVCMPRLPDSFSFAPAETETREVAMRDGGGPGLIEVEPWPFSPSEVPVVATGRLLESTFEDVEEMRAALAGAPRVGLAATLVPAESLPQTAVPSSALA